MGVLASRIITYFNSEQTCSKTQNIRNKSEWWQFLGMMRGKQYVKKGVWYIGDKKNKKDAEYQLEYLPW